MYIMSNDNKDNINQLIPLIDQRIDPITTPRFEQLLIEIRANREIMDERFKRVDDRFEAIQKQMDIRFTQSDKRFDQFLTFYRWQFGIIFFGFLGLYLKLFFV